MTHIENIPHVLKYGITHRNSPNKNAKFVTIGDISLIDTRATKSVQVDNGVFQDIDAPVITLGDYIPFYFGTRMPMLYVMQNGGNFVERATPAQDIVYLKCLLVDVIGSCKAYFFSDVHATDRYAKFYDKSKLAELPNLIDWDAVKSSYWGREENLNIKRKKQAEFLVSDDIPTKCITAFGCYNDEAKQKLLAFGIEAEKIKLTPEAYF